MAESEEELKRLLMRVKENNERGGLRLNIKKKKTKIMASGPITSWQIDGETMEIVRDYFLGLQNHKILGSKSVIPKSQIMTAAMKSEDDSDYLDRIAMTNLDSVLKSSDITL